MADPVMRGHPAPATRTVRAESSAAAKDLRPVVLLGEGSDGGLAPEDVLVMLEEVLKSQSRHRGAQAQFSARPVTGASANGWNSLTARVLQQASSRTLRPPRCW